MAHDDTARPFESKGARKQILPGQTRRASDADLRPGEPPSPQGDRHAAGTPGGGSEIGGLGGTNIGEGEPDNADLEATAGTGYEEYNLDESGPPYGGASGGAVGGTPAEGRASGGYEGDKIRPGGVHRGDSTIGTDPSSGKE